MINHITIRDSQGRIRAFLKNQDMSTYENMHWNIGKDVDGNYVSYANISADCNMTFKSGQDLFAEFFLYQGDTMSLEQENPVQTTTFEPI